MLILLQQSTSTEITAAAFQISQNKRDTQSSGSYSSSTQNVNQSTGNGHSGGYIRKDRPYCTHCHRVGHVIDKCYKKYGYPTSFKPNQRNDKAGSASISANASISEASATDLSPEQIQQLVSFLSSKLQSPAENLIPEVQSVSVSIPSSSNTCPISGNSLPSIFCSFTGVNKPYVCTLYSKSMLSMLG